MEAETGTENAQTAQILVWILCKSQIKSENRCHKWRFVTLLKYLNLQSNPKEGHRPQGLNASPVITQLPAEVSLHSHQPTIKPFNHAPFFIFNGNFVIHGHIRWASRQ